MVRKTVGYPGFLHVIQVDRADDGESRLALLIELPGPVQSDFDCVADVSKLTLIRGREGGRQNRRKVIGVLPCWDLTLCCSTKNYNGIKLRKNYGTTKLLPKSSRASFLFSRTVGRTTTKTHSALTSTQHSTAVVSKDNNKPVF